MSKPDKKKAGKADLPKKSQLTIGVHEQTLAEDEPGQSDNAKPGRKRADSELLSIFPSGLPTTASKNAKNYDLLYDWENTKGREKNIRSPSIKPEATNQDAEVLAVFRRKSATIAWEHLQHVKEKMNPEDPTNENTVKNRRKSKIIEPTPVPEVTQTDAEDFSEKIEPEHLIPPLRRPTLEPEAEPEPPPEPEPEAEPEPPPPPKPKPKPKPVAKPKPRPPCPPPSYDPCCPCPCAMQSSICCPPMQNMYYDVPRCEQTGQVTRGSCDQNRRVSFEETTIMIPDAPQSESDSDSESEGDTEEEIQYDMAENDKDCAVIIEEPLNDEENEQVAREMYQPNNCNVAVVPPRSTAFQAPIIQLPCRPCGQQGHPGDEDGVNFCFFPRGNHATEITFTVEPKRPPVWKTMMKCGFVPIINCAVPPCALPEPSQQHGAYFVDEEYESSSSSSGSSSSSYTSSSSSSGSSDDSSSSDESSEEEGSKAPTQISQISTVYSEEEETTVTVTTAPSLVVGPQLPPPPAGAGDAWKKSILKPPIKKQIVKKKESSSSSDDDDDDDVAL